MVLWCGRPEYWRLQLWDLGTLRAWCESNESMCPDRWSKIWCYGSFHDEQSQVMTRSIRFWQTCISLKKAHELLCGPPVAAQGLSSYIPDAPLPSITRRHYVIHIPRRFHLFEAHNANRLPYGSMSPKLESVNVFQSSVYGAKTTHCGWAWSQTQIFDSFQIQILNIDAVHLLLKVSSDILLHTMLKHILLYRGR